MNWPTNSLCHGLSSLDHTVQSEEYVTFYDLGCQDDDHTDEYKGTNSVLLPGGVWSN
jgi:hypothetical protein